MGFNSTNDNMPDAEGVTPSALAHWMNREVRQMPSGLRMGGCFDPHCKTGSYWRTSFREGRFRCWGCGKQGDAVQAAALLWGIPPIEARQRLEAEKAKAEARQTVAAVSMAAASSERDEQQTHAALQEVIHRVFATGVHEDTRSLLWQQGISDDVISEAQAQGLIAGLPCNSVLAKDHLERLCGKQLLQQAGLWGAGKAYPAVAFRPLWSLHTSEEGHALEVTSFESGAFAPSLHYGEVKSPFWWPGSGLPHVCASPLHALRLRTLESSDVPVMGLPGMSSWQKGRGIKPWFDDIGPELVIVFGNTQRGEQQAHELYVRLIHHKGVIASVMDFAEDTPTLEDTLKSFVSI